MKFGIPIHELGWFTDNAKRAVTKYKWDKEQDCVALIYPKDKDNDLSFDSDNEYMNTICNIFNMDSERESNGFDFDMDLLIENVFRPKN